MQIRIIILTLLMAPMLFAMYKHQNSVGIGVAFMDSPYINDSKKSIPIINLKYRYKMFYVQGLNLGVNLTKGTSLFVRPELGGYDINEVATTNDTLELGLKYVKRISSYKITLAQTKDILGVYNGGTTSVQFSKSFIRYPFIFIPNISIQSDDTKKSNYYYGVKKSSFFDTYKLHRTYDFGMGFISIYNVSHNLGIMFMTKKLYLDKEKYNSPLVNSKTREFYFLAFSHKF